MNPNNLQAIHPKTFVSYPPCHLQQKAVGLPSMTRFAKVFASTFIARQRHLQQLELQKCGLEPGLQKSQRDLNMGPPRTPRTCWDPC